MGKNIIIFAALILSFLSQIILPQNINATLNVNPYPSPYKSDWETNPSALGNILIINTTHETLPIKIRIRVFKYGLGMVFSSLSKEIVIPAVPSYIIDNTNFTRFENVNFHITDFRNKVLLSGRLPEGKYSICIDIENLDGAKLINNKCADFTILYPEPPRLISPLNNQIIENSITYPVFQWTPVIVPPIYNINYSIKIVEILPGQIALKALQSNIPIYENKNLNTNTFTYPISALPLESGKSYAWQIQTLDQYGFPPTQNEGKSEIFTFTKKSSIKNYIKSNTLNLLSPNNQEKLKSFKPQFKWNFNAGFQIGIKYHLRVAKIIGNQTLEKAINNYPILNINTSAKSFIPSSNLPINGTDNYVWQVYAINTNSNDTIQKSELRKFSLFPLVLLLPGENGNINMKRPQFQWAYYGASNKYYDLKVIKLPLFYYNQDGVIDENLFDDPQNVIYQKYNISGAQFSNVNSPTLEIPVFKPDSDIPMVDLKSYYWQISVKDQPFGNVTAKSAIRKLTFNPYQAGFATNCQVSGNLFYEFADPGEYTVYNLKNTNVKLVVKYILKYTSKTGAGSYSDFQNHTHSASQGSIELNTPDLPATFKNDNQKTIGIGKTDNNGFFSFSLMNLKPMGVVEDNFSLTHSGEFGYVYTGKLYRVLRLIVQSPYYTSPSKDIEVQPGETKHYGQLIAYVRSYSLTATIKSPGTWWNNQFLSANSPIPKMIVYLLRKNRPSQVPNNEGIPRPQNQNDKPINTLYGSEYEVIGKSVTDNNGRVKFKRLVKSIYSQNDEYFIYSVADSNQTSLYYKSFLPVSYNFKYPGDNAVYSNEYYYVNTTKDFTVLPINPSVKGKIKREDGGQPLPNAQVKLLNYALFWWQEDAKTITNSAGEFRFDNLKSIYNENGGTLRVRFVD